MTIKELIIELQKYNPELPVWIPNKYFISEETGMGEEWCDPKIVDLETSIHILPEQ